MTPDHGRPTLSVLTTRADEIRAEMIARVLDGVPGPQGVRPCLSGSLTGPRRRRDTTLQTSVPLVACGGAETAARATFTEPAFWTPEMPNLYRLEARLSHGDLTTAIFDRMVGLRRLGVRGRSFWLDGRRWVPRGVSATSDAFNPRLLHDLHAAVELRDPTSPLLADADECGVAVFCRLEDATGRPLATEAASGRLSAWSSHPSAAIVVVPAGTPAVVAAAVAGHAPASKGAMLVGLEVDGTRPPDANDPGLADLFDCIVVDLPDDAVPHDAWRDSPVEKPLVARRRATERASGPTPTDEPLADRRRGCERLQATLAAWGLAGGAGRCGRDWAGYLVAAW